MRLRSRQGKVAHGLLAHVSASHVSGAVQHVARQPISAHRPLRVLTYVTHVYMRARVSAARPVERSFLRFRSSLRIPLGCRCDGLCESMAIGTQLRRRAVRDASRELSRTAADIPDRAAIEKTSLPSLVSSNTSRMFFRDVLRRSTCDLQPYPLRGPPVSFAILLRRRVISDREERAIHDEDSYVNIRFTFSQRGLLLSRAIFLLRLLDFTSGDRFARMLRLRQPTLFSNLLLILRRYYDNHSSSSFQTTVRAMGYDIPAQY